MFKLVKCASLIVSLRYSLPQMVYHTLVLPHNPIVNFMTKFSGITRQMLFNVTKRLEEVQQDLQKLLPPDAILVGHSLDSDLKVMKVRPYSVSYICFIYSYF